MGVAIFSALQDNREATTQIQSTLDGMQGSLEVAVREASRKGLQEAIKELKDEAYSIGRSGLRGNVGGGGFTAGEAEKIISQVSSSSQVAQGVGSLMPSCEGHSSSTSFRPKRD